MKNVLKPLAKSVLIPLRLTAVVSPKDAAIHKKMFWSGCPRMFALRPSNLASRMTAIIVSNEEMNDTMKIVKSLEESGLLIKGVSKTIKMKQKQKKGKQNEGFLSMLLNELGVSLLGNLPTGKCTIINGEGTIRAGQHF